MKFSVPWEKIVVLIVEQLIKRLPLDGQRDDWRAAKEAFVLARMNGDIKHSEHTQKLERIIMYRSFQQVVEAHYTTPSPQP